MVIYQYQGNWVASEKLAIERKAIEAIILSFLGELLASHGCTEIDMQTWMHASSDTIFHLSCMPRTHH